MDIFHDGTKTLPKSDSQIVRAPFEQQEIGGRKSHVPSDVKSDKLPITHVKNNH